MDNILSSLSILNKFSKDPKSSKENKESNGNYFSNKFIQYFSRKNYTKWLLKPRNEISFS